MKTPKAYRFRFYPTTEQVQLLSRTFGCVRYVYNWALKAKTDAYLPRGQAALLQGFVRKIDDTDTTARNRMA